ncbi:histidine phosphatase family protein [Actinomycetospora sp. TBRC 11914]|uniref:histidine phosphatase family protein n=1 Tax=Actinomycetospora sp. TBRC 11914 TaxID=2729387 RepID=UPI0028A00DB8|nr:histidine phosphatase family protein [Actinomycetospora sp. TBRC 11914]
MITRLVLLRHGRTAWNAERRMQGRLDPPLDGTGLAHAQAVAPVVAGFAPTVLLCSDQSRALQTALAVAEATGLEPRKEPRLREADVGQWQGLVDTEVEQGWPGQLDRWHVDPTATPPGGESRVDAAQRALPVLRELVGTPGPGTVGDTAVLVAHGAVISATTSAFLGWPVEQWPSLGPLGNCRWSLLEFRPDRWRLVQWNAGA